MELLLVGLLVGYILGRLYGRPAVGDNIEAFKTRVTAAERLSDRNLQAIGRISDGLHRGTVTAQQVQGLANALEDTTYILTDIIEDHGRLLRQAAGGEHGRTKAND